MATGRRCPQSGEDFYEVERKRLVEDVDGQLVPSDDTVAARDRYVVCREPLAQVYQSFVTDWNRKHEPDNGRFAANQQRRKVTQVRAVQWLADETRRNDPRGVGIPETAILNMFRRTPQGQLRYHTIEFSTADALVSAIGRPEVFYTDNLRPRLRSEASCCSGSFTGVVSPHRL